MQLCLLHRTIPALTASLRSRVLPSLYTSPLNAQKQHKQSAHDFHSSLRAASAVAEAPSTDVGAGLPVIIETSNVPVSAAFNSMAALEGTDMVFNLMAVVSACCGTLQVYLYVKQNEMEDEVLKQLIALAASPLPVGYVSAMPGEARSFVDFPY